MGQQTSTIFRLSDVDPGQARITGADGGTPIGTSVTYGQDDYGADHKVFGNTSGTYVLWDESVDTLKLVGTAAKFKLGAFTGAASGTGSVLSSTSTAALRVYTDDGGAAIGSGQFVRSIVGRNLLTYTSGNREQEAGGVVGQVVSVAGTNRHNMAGTWGSYEARTSLTVGGQSAATDTWCQAGVLGRVGMSTGTLVVGTNAVLAGVAAMSNVNSAVNETLTGAYTAFYAGAWASAIDWAYGLYLEGGKFTTGIAIGSCTTGITITSASGYAIDIATTGQFRMGVQGTGIPTATDTPYAMEVHAETNASAIIEAVAEGTGFTAGIRCRYEISKAQTAQVGFQAIEGRLRPKAAMADGLHCGISGTIEADGGVAFTGTATTQRSAGNFCIELGEACTFGSTSGWLTGITIDSSIHATQTGTGNITFPALRIKKADSKLSWQYGIYMDDGGCTDGIYLSATTKACDMNVTALPANARGARFNFTCATPAMSDGIGAFETNFSVSGTATSSAFAASTWTNLGGSGIAAGNTGCHSDGIYADSGGVNGAAMCISRFQFVSVDSNFSQLSIWQLNFNQTIDCIFDVNDRGKALGLTVATPTAAACGSIPFLGTNGVDRLWIRVYADATT
jgi:hypothetical protein